MKKERIDYSDAENKFYKYMKENYPELEITKKGLPDFMITDKSNNVIGFVEVKRMDITDNLRKEQIIFRKFCEKRHINYNVWRPGLDKFRDKITASKFRQKTTAWEV